MERTDRLSTWKRRLRTISIPPRGTRGRLPWRLAPLLALCLLAAGCTTTTAPRVSTQYYEVSGSTAREIDREIRRKGPNRGKAVAMAGISIEPVALEPVASGGLCRFRKARFRVDAAITLPRWREAASSRDDALRQSWEGFAAYARAHEETHVRIAELFARELERSLLAVPPQPSCTRLEAIGLEIVRRAAALHRETQLAFDAGEQKRFARLAAQAGRERR